MRKHAVRSGIIFVLIILSSCMLVLAGERTLYWDRIDVEARLDDKGELHISEKQLYVFNGAWNGGERIFNIKSGEELLFHSLTRIDAETGMATVMKEGDLNVVDNYEWVESNKIRWRSRTAESLPFDDTRILYILDYSYSKVLVKEDDVYHLDFNFLFPHRDGPVKNFTLKFTIDHAWALRDGNTLHFSAKNLEPGRGFVLDRTLTYRGTGKPEVQDPLSHGVVDLSILVSYLLFVLYFIIVMVHDFRKGRFTAIPHYTDLDETHLEKNLFNIMPEEAGVIWDDSLGSHEVSAILTRLVAEGKLHSELVPAPGILPFKKKKMLQLRLDPSAVFSKDYEQKLIDGLFFDGRTAVNTQEVRDHYYRKRKNFSPSGLIQPGLMKRIYKNKIIDETFPKFLYKPLLVLVAAYAAILILGGIIGGIDFWGILLGMLIAQLFGPVLIGSIFTYIFIRRLLAKPVLTFILGLLAGAAPFKVLQALVFFEEVKLNIFQLIGLECLTIAVACFLALMSGTANSREKLKLRRELIAIRNYFKRELKKEKPRLEDGWFPYLVAFGLARNMDRWAREYGAATGYAFSSGTHSGHGASAGMSAAGWTGGGGRFGGAGASRAWASASGAMSSSISKSSSGSGGSSGGGSSGGGGGGGW